MAARKKTMANHRAVLGIGLNATYRVAKVAYHKASLAAHPDKGGTTEKMAAVNAAWEAYIGKDATASGNDDDDDADTESDVMGDDDEDEGYASSLSEPEDETHSDSDDDYKDGSDDERECAFDTNYGDLKETGGRYKVQLEDGREVTLDEHEEICGCDLDAEDAVHLLVGAATEAEADMEAEVDGLGDDNMTEASDDSGYGSDDE